MKDWLNGFLCAVLACGALLFMGQAESEPSTEAVPPEIPTEVLQALGEDGYQISDSPWTMEDAPALSIQHAIQSQRHRARTQVYILNELRKQRLQTQNVARMLRAIAGQMDEPVTIRLGSGEQNGD